MLKEPKLKLRNIYEKSCFSSVHYRFSFCLLGFKFLPFSQKPHFLLLCVGEVKIENRYSWRYSVQNIFIRIYVLSILIMSKVEYLPVVDGGPLPLEVNLHGLIAGRVGDIWSWGLIYIKIRNEVIRLSFNPVGYHRYLTYLILDSVSFSICPLPKPDIRLIWYKAHP